MTFWCLAGCFLSAFLSVVLGVFLSIFLSVFPSVFLSVFPCVILNVLLNLPWCLPGYLPECLPGWCLPWFLFELLFRTVFLDIFLSCLPWLSSWPSPLVCYLLSSWAVFLKAWRTRAVVGELSGSPMARIKQVSGQDWLSVSGLTRSRLSTQEKICDFKFKSLNYLKY